MSFALCSLLSSNSNLFCKHFSWKVFAFPYVGKISDLWPHVKFQRKTNIGNMIGKIFCISGLAFLGNSNMGVLGLPKSRIGSHGFLFEGLPKFSHDFSHEG